ncbi:sensor domain-containing protein [Streptomyces varsoviensis]|uniref:sensor histidine kinase n=1 Tax=Streptomyces varsoviensis TaxID=67373 RepID=UPI0033CBBCE2
MERERSAAGDARGGQGERGRPAGGDAPGGQQELWWALRRRGYVRTRWPWRSAAYLATGAMCGAGAFGLLVTLILVGTVLSVLLIGLPLLAAICLAGVPMGALERHRVRLLGGTAVRDPHPAVARPGFVAWARTRLGEPVTWRELGYLFAFCLLLWPVDLAALAIGLLLPVGVLYEAGSVAVGVNGQVRLLPGWEISSLPQAAAAGLLGVVWLPAGAYLTGAVAGCRAELTRLVLGRREAEFAQRLLEVSRSRARLVDAFDAERRRIERDLHDGAQQRLVALTMLLGLAAMSEGAEAAALLAKAQDQAGLALEELRELIQGIHPQVLTDRGLPSAVHDVADRSPVPVDVAFEELPGRLPQAVETTAYFAICEVLANVAKHSGADRATVRGGLVDGRLVVRVEDNGAGGADPAEGTGLLGLADRLAVVDGRLLISSPAGGPTLVRVEIPVGDGVAGGARASGF